MNLQKNLNRFKKETPKGQRMAIASNFRRLSNLAYHFTPGDETGAIDDFLAETEAFLKEIDEKEVSENYQRRLKNIKEEFPTLKDRWQTAQDNKVRLLIWAEKMLTWSNLLS